MDADFTLAEGTQVGGTALSLPQLRVQHLVIESTGATQLCLWHKILQQHGRAYACLINTLRLQPAACQPSHSS